jgi:Ni,Fe-hydrogenase III large subunit
MSRFQWLPDYLAGLALEHVVVLDGASAQPSERGPAWHLRLEVEDWSTAARVAATTGCRWAGVWGDHLGDAIEVRACLELHGDYLVLATRVPLAQPVLASHTPYYPAAERLERHLQDMLGVAFLDHPDGRRWTRHQAWREQDYPLRTDFPVHGRISRRTPADADYPFTRVLGPAVHEIPVGPVHAGIIEPGHFRFQAVGEEVLRLEERLGYVHKGIEKLAVGRDAEGLARLAGRISGDATVAHTWAACMAMERALGVGVPARALTLRGVFAERERIANHLGDIGAICNDVGFGFLQSQFSRLRETWQRSQHAAFGHRLLMDCVVPGGVACDVSDDALHLLASQHDQLDREMDDLMPIVDDYPSLEDRLCGTGVLREDDARTLGALGYVGKASGIDYDVRRDHSYAPYDRFSVPSPCLRDGDVAARLDIRAAEIRDSLHLLRQLCDSLTAGPVRSTWPTPMGGSNDVTESEGLGIVESWRGEVLTFVRFDANGLVARFFPRDPSWFAWPALERLIAGNIVPDFPVCNKSVNASYSGHDL